ncbi:three-Cys-motif partner protein TcmP [uncultured Selenomonas sp.]|uniref:three-Cys-motif partner protein TcmP n=1 Tax=uncultured Selenomonas sp. TaxID=159275 RepID=UPI00262F2F82|nr:three-Cys-motif partner protein TcmP [uncultured Selenomonas sp.]
MAKKNDDFFVEKKPWSKVKDELLGCYLKPYVAKILYTRKPLAYVDCFAGKGKFDDGNPGSPLIALDIFRQGLASTKLDGNARIGATFIDLNYASDLEMNLSAYKKRIKIVSGAYEDTIEELLKSKIGYNVFLYIDPYGIKALDCTKFDAFANGQFNTIELLINMNSFGFIREACNAMGTKFKVDDRGFFDDLIEYDPTILNATDKSIEALNRIAGGDYWKGIIAQYKSGAIDGYKAEEYFSKQYCQRLSESYRYVLNMPIRIQQNQHPKYRMIHATNHPSGCVLMADNVCNRWEILKDIQSGGQLALFQEDFNSQIIDKSTIKKRVIEHFSQCDTWISLTEAEAVFYVKYGAICKSGEITKVLKELEKDGRLAADRKPAFSEKTNRPTTFMSEGHGQTVSVKWVK